MPIKNFTTTGTQFSIVYDGLTQGTWERLDELDSKYDLDVRDSSATLSLRNPGFSDVLKAGDTIQVNGTELSGTFRDKMEALKNQVLYLSSPGSALPTETVATYSAMQTSISSDPTTKRDFFVSADETNGGAKTSYRWNGSRIQQLSKNPTKSLTPYNETLFTPVTIVDGAADASTTITNSVLISPDNSVFRYTGGSVAFVGTTYPNNLFYTSSGVSNPVYNPLYSVEFDFDGLEFELYYKKNGGVYRLVINGSPVTTAWASLTGTNGSLYLKKITFADRQIRRIKIEMANNFNFGGVRRGANDTVFYPSNLLGKKAVIMGDSFTEQYFGFGWHLGRLLGWQTPLLSGVGGTGYLNPSTGGKVKYRDRVQSDVISKNPDVVIVQGGINDSSYSASAVGTEAGLLYDNIISGLPFAKLIVLGVISPSGSPNATTLGINAALKTQAESRGLIFIDPISEAWITGTWNVANSGNAVNYTSSDGTHPTEEGGRYLGARVASKLLNLAPDTVSI